MDPLKPVMQVTVDRRIGAGRPGAERPGRSARRRCAPDVSRRADKVLKAPAKSGLARTSKNPQATLRLFSAAAWRRAVLSRRAITGRMWIFCMDERTWPEVYE